MKKDLKVFTCGVLSGAIILLSGGHYFGYNVKKENSDSKNEFSLPQIEKSFKNTKEVEQYTFEYNGSDITIQGDKVTVYSFDENGNLKTEDGKKAEVPIDDYNYLLGDYVSQTEAAVFYRLKNKDNKEVIKNQYDVYLIFYWMDEAFKEYFNRESFSTMQDRKDVICKACDEYINDEIKIGGYKFSDLGTMTQNNILVICKDISEMYKNNKIEEKNAFSKFIDRQRNVLEYTLSKIGNN